MEIYNSINKLFDSFITINKHSLIINNNKNDLELTVKLINELLTLLNTSEYYRIKFNKISLLDYKYNDIFLSSKLLKYSGLKIYSNIEDLYNNKVGVDLFIFNNVQELYSKSDNININDINSILSKITKDKYSLSIYNQTDNIYSEKFYNSNIKNLYKNIVAINYSDYIKICEV